MTKREFIKRIDQVKRLLKYRPIYGCCRCLEKFGINPDYFDLCAPYTLRGQKRREGFDGWVAYWLGDRYSEKALQRRLYWLDFFREMMIATGYYKEL